MRVSILFLVAALKIVHVFAKDHEIVEEVDDDEDEGKKFEDCYFNPIELIREEFGVIRVCMLMEDSIKKNFCKRIVDCADRILGDEDTIKDELDYGTRSGRERLDDFNQGHDKYSDEEFRDLAHNTFAFLFEAGCYRDTPDEFEDNLGHYMYWFIQQVEMQKCFSLRSKRKLDGKKFKIWQRRMESRKRYEYEMELIEEFIAFHSLDDSWPPKLDLEPILYNKIIKNDDGRPLGSARYAFIFDRTKLRFDNVQMRQSFREGLDVVVKLFDCWDEGNEECLIWEMEVDKAFVKHGVETIPETEWQIFQDLHRFIPDPEDDVEDESLRERTKKKQRILRKFGGDEEEEDRDEL